MKQIALEDILRHGITRAVMSVEFYSTVVERIEKPEARQLLERILDQEFTSLQQLVELLERHRRQRASETSTAK